MSSLYELTGQYLSLMDIAEDADPDVLRDTLELIDGEIEDKADNYAKVIKNLEGESKTIEEEIERLNRKKKGIDNSIDSIKKNLERCMIVTGKRKFKTTLFSFGIQKNAPSVNVKDESKGTSLITTLISDFLVNELIPNILGTSMIPIPLTSIMP